MEIEYDEMIVMRADFIKMIRKLGLEVREASIGGPMTITRPPMCETNYSKEAKLPYVAARRSVKVEK